LNKFGECDPNKAAIRIKRDAFERYELPLVCVHCDEPICRDVCPQNAYCENEGIILHDDERCMLCGICALYCPNMGINFTGDHLIKCDLCGGDPLCVKYCSTEAIVFVEAEVLPKESREMHSERIMESKGGKQSSIMKPKNARLYNE
jgi:Fe-S-cluster-containing hydrogenase component 2